MWVYIGREGGGGGRGVWQHLAYQTHELVSQIVGCSPLTRYLVSQFQAFQAMLVPLIVLGNTQLIQDTVYTLQ